MRADHRLGRLASSALLACFGLQLFSFGFSTTSPRGGTHTTITGPIEYQNILLARTNVHRVPRVARKLLQQTGSTQYEVVSGDSLSAIAAAHGVTLPQLLAANPEISDPNLIQAGQTVTIPAAGAPVEAPASTGTAQAIQSPRPAPSQSGSTYTVQSGDSLFLIATRYGVSLQQLQNANPSITNPDVITPGEVLHIPTDSPAPAPAIPPGLQKYYTVAQGDSLSSIAATFDTTVEAIQAVNPQITDINKITIGEAIAIPQATTGSAAAPPPSSSSSNTGAIVGGVVGGVVGAALILGLIFFLIRRRKKPTAPPTVASWKSGPSIGNPFDDAEMHTGAHTNVDVLFKGPNLPSLVTDKKSAKNSAEKGHAALTTSSMAASSSTEASSGMDDSAMVTDISALDHFEARKVDFGQMPSSVEDTELVDSAGGRKSVYFREEAADQSAFGAPLSDTWKIESDILQCRVKDGVPIRLGRGGGGSVYLGVLLKSTVVAIKVVERPTLKEQRRFELEIELLRACHHPNVIQFLGANVRPDKTFLVMELCAEGDLFNHIHRDTSGQFLWSNRGRGIALDIARGLTYLHSRNILHLDIKSPNVLLTANFDAKISDIGLGRVIDAGNDGPEGPAGASYWWSAPEQLMGEACTTASDIYSFGVVLWELCTGEQPIERRLREIRVPQEAPLSIADLLARCWDHNPAARPSAVEIHATIRRDTY